MIPAGPVPQMDLLEETKGLVFRFASSPGTVPERSYLANNPAQKRMSYQLRFEMAKHNFPAKVNRLFIEKTGSWNSPNYVIIGLDNLLRHFIE